MSFTKTLLAGAAVCALCTAPALARQAPPIHLAGVESAMKVKAGSPGHYKTNIVHQNANSFTETLTFTGTLSTAADRKVPILLDGETWYSSATCIPAASEKGVFKQTTAAAKITNGSETGTLPSCGSTVFTFYGPVYDLKAKNATSDSFPGAVVAKHFSGYNLTLNENTELTITP